MDREKLKETLKNLTEPTLNPEDDMVDGFKLRYFLKETIDALLEDDKPTMGIVKIEEVEEREECKLIAIRFPAKKIKHDWTPEEVKAIKESIIHWRDNVSRLKLADELGIEIVKGWGEWWIDDKKLGEIQPIIAYFDNPRCPLCQDYSGIFTCPKCPLYRSGNNCRNEGSSWDKCYKAKGNKEIISSAENMVHTLESLLE